MLCCLFFCFLHYSKYLFVGSYVVLRKATAFSLVLMFFTFKTMRFFGSYEFSIETNAFFVGSYALHSKTISFSLAPMLFTLKPLLSRWLLCFSHSNQCFCDGSYVF